jgi:hypothetical protein
MKQFIHQYKTVHGQIQELLKRQAKRWRGNDNTDGTWSTPLVVLTQDELTPNKLKNQQQSHGKDAVVLVSSRAISNVTWSLCFMKRLMEGWTSLKSTSTFKTSLETRLARDSTHPGPKRNPQSVCITYVPKFCMEIYRRLCKWWTETWILRKIYICVILAEQKHDFLWFEYSNDTPKHSNSHHPSFSEEKRCKASSLLPPSLGKVKTHCCKRQCTPF